MCETELKKLYKHEINYVYKSFGDSTTCIATVDNIKVTCTGKTIKMAKINAQRKLIALKKPQMSQISNSSNDKDNRECYTEAYRTNKNYLSKTDLISISKNKDNYNNDTSFFNVEKTKISKEVLDLITKYKEIFKEGEYTVFCLEKNEIRNYKVVEAKKVVRYHGGTDANGYAQGQLIEELEAKIDPINGIISNLSPMGQKLLQSDIGNQFNVKGKTYVLLNKG